MKKIRTTYRLTLLACTALFISAVHAAPLPGDLWASLNLGDPALKNVAQLQKAGKDREALEALTQYFKTRKGIRHPEISSGTPTEEMPSEADIKKANDGLQHVLFAHKGYKPLFYGEDIDWTYWPVKDNELRFQLHRMYWWESMGKVYRFTNDERYAKEWVLQYKDWIAKNTRGRSAENDRFAWRPLEVSARVEGQIGQFCYFLPSPHFDADFLAAFLVNFSDHADHLLHHMAERGNHRLFEAQRLIFAGAFFPEFKAAGQWVETGIGILTEEIGKQVYPDGLQYELSFNYHVAAINIFIKALEMLEINGKSGLFPESYGKTLEKMVLAVTDFSFPDYSYPMFSDAKLEQKSDMLRNYTRWSKLFSKNPVIRYHATDRKEGHPAPYLSHALPHGGIYTFRSGWDENATVMVLKASPPAFWHSQPDNGTFELFIKGTNFFPDAGCYVYGGNEEVLKERNWFRQTRVHNTLTLNNENLEINQAKALLWETTPQQDVLVYENPSYPGLTHRRSVFFIDRQFFVIVDEATGAAEGDVAIHFGLKEGEVKLLPGTHGAQTLYPGLNNIYIRSFPAQNAETGPEEGWVSYAYRQKQERTAFSVKSRKNREPVRFATVILPTDRANEDGLPHIEAKILEAASDRLRVQVTVDQKNYYPGYHLKPKKDE